MIKSIDTKKLFLYFVLSFILALASFSIYSLVTGVMSLASIEEGWDGESIATSLSKGNGTEENPYLIESPEEFMYFKSLIEGEKSSSYQNLYYALDKDIDFNDKEITPIGISLEEEERIFKGHFNGNGYTLKNFVIKEGASFGEDTYYGLFSKTIHSSIENLNIDNYSIIPSVDRKIILGGLVGYNQLEEHDESTYQNISIRGLYVDFSSNTSSENVVSLFVNSDDNTKNKNIYMQGKMNGNGLNKISITDGEVDGFIFNVDVLDSSEDIDFTGIYHFLEKQYFLNEEEVSLSTLLFSLNDGLDSSFYWEVEEDQFVLKNHLMDEEEAVPVPESSKSFSFSIREEAATVPLHDSGISGTSVYINDLDSDLNYYLGRNYTTSPTEVTPTGTNLGLYSTSNLVKVYMQYSSTDFNNSSLSGRVSVNENYTDIYYYKYYPVVDGYVTFDLIDNPWAVRPSGKAFNGWVTDYEGAEISLDMSYYIRSVKIPATGGETIQIKFETNWTEATSVIGTDFSSLKSTGMVYYEPDIETVWEDVSNYYVLVHIDRYDYYPTNVGRIYDTNGNRITATYCNRNRGCDYLRLNNTSVYDSNTDYYNIVFDDDNNVIDCDPYTPTYTQNISYYFHNGENMAGNFEKVVVSRGQSRDGYYDEDGNLLTTNCGYTTCDCYKLVQYYDENGNPSIVDNTREYYYLVTRDTNIMILRGNTTYNGLDITKPVTITGVNANNQLTGAVITTSNRDNYGIELDADARIEELSFGSGRPAETGLTNNRSSYQGIGTSNIVANYHNLKIGRGVEVTNGRYISGVYGGTSLRTSVTRGSTNDLFKYSLIVESGDYNNIYYSESFYGAGTLTMYGKCTLGSDIDRVKEDNSTLNVYYSFQGNAGSSLTMRGANGNSSRIYDLYVKSGNYGTSERDIYTGIYVGGRGGDVYGNRSITIEGGNIYTIIGGLGTGSSMANNNATYIFMKGGKVGSIFGGSGSGATYGNRIVSVTGGEVTHSVFGGSNGSTITEQSTDTGILYGDSFIYIGGDAEIGTSNDTVYNAEAGSVFGAGAGATTKDGLGSVDNSYIIVDGSCNIHTNVYGGGNYGSVGAKSTASTSTTNIKILNGTIGGSVYGGGNQNGSGATNVTSTVSIDQQGGSVGASIYGGSRTKGIIYGSTNVTVNGGTVGADVYGGGEGGYSSNTNFGTYVRDNVSVVVNSGSISGSVYGGSAYGTVNAINQNTNSSSATTTVTINGGTITNSVFGGAKGSDTYTPKVVGDITVNVNGGSIGKVFGGFDASGKPSAGDVVYLNDGTIGNAFGGGNNANQDTTDIRLQGSTITGNLYGGSNLLGTVTTSNVTVTSGSVTDIYGGNNLDGLTVTSNVHVTGSGCTITGDIYGGGNEATSGVTNVDASNRAVNTIYGGGKKAGATTTNITTTGLTAGVVFGGSNDSGDVTTSNVEIGTSTLTSVYGGNNQGGETATTNVDITSSTVTNVFGGGDNAESGTSHVIVHSGVITNVYGGGNDAGLDTSNVTIEGGTITNVFGGSNSSGEITVSNVTVSGGDITSLYGGNNEGGYTYTTHVTTTGGDIDTIYGGGNEATVGTTNVTIGASTSIDVYGGGNAAGVDGDTTLRLTDSTVTNNIYGGGNEGIVSGSTNVYVTDSSIQGNAFAGGNGASAVVYTNSTITIDGDTEIGTSSSVAPNDGCVFGSGNAASTGLSSEGGSVATVNIVGGTIHGNVYGGPKMAVVYGVSETNIGSSAVNDNSLTESDIIISGSVFGGGESNASGSATYDWTFISVTEGINVLIDGTDYITNGHDFIINGSIFGSGNASSSAGDSVVYIKNLGTESAPNQAVSIQRATVLTIDHSVIELSGAKDRTNAYEDILYSFNMIDSLISKNGTTLLLQHNANMLMSYYSGVDSGGTLVPATVSINEDTKTVTKNVDNRIYMLPGQNLNITTNQGATAYGPVTGMTFFGMYMKYDNGNYRYGLYDRSLNYGTSGNAGLEIVGGSYVLGLRYNDHDITKDGFYSNYLNDTYTEVKVDYIDPSPVGSTGYRWIIGFDAINYEFTLIASKYSSLGTHELQLIDFADGNTNFTVLGFDSTALNEGVSLVPSTSVPRVASTQAEANSIFGLAMKSETQEWTGYGTSEFLSRNDGDFTGDTVYGTDNRAIPPSLMFYFYHAKNIELDANLGTVVITMQAAVPISPIDYDIKFITVTVHLTAKPAEEGDSYDAAIAYDKKYEMPSSTLVNITNQSQFSAYYSLMVMGETFANVYGNNNTNHHVLVTNNPLPVGTLITMLDFGANDNRPEYYYFEVTQSIYDDSVQQLATYNEITYSLSNFIKMDSTSSGNHYEDATNNLLYYDTSSSLVDEEFMFIVDFKETNTTGDHLNNTLLLELRTADERTVYTVLGIREGLMVYNTYDSSNAVLQQNIENLDNYLYYDVPSEFSYSTAIQYDETDNRQSVIDTNYESSKMGMNAMLLDTNGEVVSSSLLIGTNIKINGVQYFADGDGIFRIKLANKVSNLNRSPAITIGSDLPPATYTLRFTLFASDDGLHNSDPANSVTRDFTVIVASSDNLILADCEDTSKIVDGETGLNMDQSAINTYTISYESQLTNPNLRVEIYKRTVTDVNSITYVSVPFTNLFKTTLTTASGNEKYIDMGGLSEKSFDFELQDNLTSGTYRIVFKLYDGGQLIDDDVKYVIVRKNVE